ncbi:TonB-dependent receptor plug domain-containing protein [Spirosoma utsteinense]|nr:TonB-dependent receptor [Spirosoma utsteinense]MBC3787295.1 hypothetical protein [Spirosoma utsteinense]
MAVFLPKRWLVGAGSPVRLVLSGLRALNRLRASFLLPSRSAGLRFATYRVIHQINYQFVEPRFLLGYKLTPLSSIKVAYARMNQPLHLVTNPGFGIPVDLWFPANGPIKPQQSDQVSVAYSRDMVVGATHQLELSVEGYYKKMSNIVAYRDGHSSQDFTMLSQGSSRRWEAVVTTGQGTAYGAEVFLQKKQGRLTGWLGYTVSWTIHQFDELNQGKPFAARQDRRHDVSVVGIYPISKRWSINGTWIYQTGQPVTLPQAVYGQVNVNIFTNRLDPYGGVLFTYGERNSYRMKATHRLDVSIQRKTTHKWGVGQLELSMYNAYNRKNPYFYYLALGNTVKAVSLFQIIPSLSYTFNIYTGKKPTE